MNNEKLYKFVEDVLKNNELNRLPEEYGSGIIFSKPLIGIAKGDDPIFKEYNEIIKETYLTPLEFWEKNGLEMNNIKESDIRAVSIVFPYDDVIREKSKNATKFPANIYCVARNFANALIFYVLDKIIAYFKILNKNMLVPLRKILIEKYD